MVSIAHGPHQALSGPSQRRAVVLIVWGRGMNLVSLARPLTGAVLCAVLVIGVIQPAVAGDVSTAPAGRSAVEPVESAPDESGAMEAALEQGHDVIVDSATSETTLVVAQPDGTFQLTVDSMPVRVEQDGEWVAVDTTLVDAGTGWIAPRATTVPVEFTLGGGAELARVQLESGDWLLETWPLGPLPEPKVDGATATYLDVLPDVDLRLTATADGMHEVFIIHTEAAAQNPDLLSLSIGVEGVSVFDNPDGSTTAVPLGEDNDGVAGAGLRSNAAHAWDSSDAESDVDGPGGLSSALPVESGTDADGINLDVSSVVDADVTYPLYIDPDWTGGQLHAWYVAATYPNQAYVDGGAWTDGNQQMGFIAGAYSADGLNQLVRAFWQMPTSAVAGKTIIAAAFNTTLVWGFNCTASPMQLWRVTGAPVGGTWNSTAGASWAQYLDGKNIAAGRSGCPATGVGFTVTSGVAAVAAAGDSSITFGMRASDEGSSSGWKRWAVGAQLIVTYNTTPTVSVPSVANKACATDPAAPVYANGTAALSAVASAADVDGGNLSTRAYIQTASGTPANWAAPTNALSSGVAPSGYLTTASQAQGAQVVSIAANTLAPGHYRVSVATYDGIAESARSVWCYLEVKNAPPALPGVVDVAPGPYTVGVATTLRFTANPADQVAGFVYWWAYSSSTSPAPAVPVSVASAPPCTSGSGPARYACADVGGSSTLIEVAPVAQTATLWVASYDRAGNVSGTTYVSYAAGPDEVNVDFGTGHGWDTQYLGSPLTSAIDDSNTSSPAQLVLGQEVLLDKTSEVLVGLGQQPVLAFGRYRQIATYTSSSLKLVGIDGRPGLAASNSTEFILGWIRGPLQAGETQPPGTAPVYNCDTGVPNFTPRLSRLCTTRTLVGYIETTGDPARLVVECKKSSFDYVAFVSCGSDTYVETLGYIPAATTTTTASTVVNPAASFTVSAWLNPTSVSQAGTALSQYESSSSNLSLGISGGAWQFCANGSCSIGPAATAGQWQFVTGVWDAVNRQVRIFVGDSVAPAAVTWRTPPVTVMPTALLRIGNTQVPGASGQWRGFISNPTLFQGVANKLQRQNLCNQYPPN